MVASIWRSAFLVTVPLGVAAIVFARRSLVESRAPRRRSALDLRGAGLLTVALATLTLGIVKGRDWGWAFSAASLVVAAVSATLLDSAPQGDGAARVPVEPPRRYRPRLPDLPKAPAAASIVGPQPDVNAVGPLADLPLFVGLPTQIRAAVEASASLIDLPGGAWLFRQGDLADGLYAVRAGRLEVIRDGVVVNELGRGATVGELSLLTGSVRSASVRALRDSRLLRLSRDQFDTITAAEPAMLRGLATTVAGWLQTSRPRRSGEGRPGVVAVVGADEVAPVEAVADLLVAELSRYLTVSAPGRVEPSGLERAELSHDLVVLVAEGADEQWRAFCLRQADRVILVASTATASPAAPALTERETALVLVGGRPPRVQLGRWHDTVSPRSAYLVGADPQTWADGVRPLARRIAGRSVGLVLGGGGARAFAHIGVIEELESAGIVVDRIAGTSVGSIIGAFYASGLDADGIDALCFEEFVRRNPFNDYSVPRVALSRGNKLLAGLVRCFGELIIEELAREFCCVSVDLLARDTVTHRRGSVVDAVRASLSLPGLYPPHLVRDRLLVDGGLLDNLPVAALAHRDDGPIIAVHISVGGDGEQWGTPRMPGLRETLMRSMMMSSASAAEVAMSRADIVIRPDVQGVGLLEFHQLDRMRAAGRAAARTVLDGLDGRSLAGLRGESR